MNNQIMNAIEEVKNFIAVDQNPNDAYDFCEMICVKYSIALFRISDAVVLLERLESERPISIHTKRYVGEGGNLVDELTIFAIENGIDLDKIN